MGKNKMEKTTRKPMSEETKEKIKIAKQGIHVSPKTEFKKGCIPHNKGKKMIKGIGKDHPNWNGGSSRYWSYKTLLKSGKRIDQCQICKEVIKTQIHHINGNKKDNKINNLGVVCNYCHYAIHNNGKDTTFQTGHKNLYLGGGI